MHRVHLREPLPTPFAQFVGFKYDRSGRSSGVAIISFETAEEAALAKNGFDGKLAKGNTSDLWRACRWTCRVSSVC